MSSNGLEVIYLDRGVLSIEVEHLVTSRRLLVHLPDGELEDIGTRFRVAVESRKTRRITVSEGGVMFRRVDGTSTTIRAGGEWNAAPDIGPFPSAEPAPANPSSAAVPSTDARPATSNPLAPSFHPSAGRVAYKAPASISARASAPAPVAIDEDLAYMRIMGLVRERRSTDAKRAAEEYLRQFPAGFRRVEVARIAARPEPGLPAKQ
jgi:hypothetical protein